MGTMWVIQFGYQVMKNSGINSLSIQCTSVAKKKYSKLKEENAKIVIS